jgi:hypothetical protein
MKRVFYVTLMLSAFLISGNVSTVWSASAGLEPDPWERINPAQITKASRDLISVVGNEAKIIAINGNVITLQSLTDKTKTSKVTVDNISLFKTGQDVKVTRELLSPR